MQLDIMANVGGQRPVFTVNNTVNSVPLLKPQGYWGVLQNAMDQTLFACRDHVTVLSIGFALPLGFQLYPNGQNDKPLTIDFLLRETISGSITQLDRFYLPFDSYELSIGKFYELGNNVVKTFELLLHIPEINNKLADISMINCPDSLNTLTFQGFCFAKIQHTIVLTAIP